MRSPPPTFGAQPRSKCGWRARQHTPARCDTAVTVCASCPPAPPRSFSTLDSLPELRELLITPFMIKVRRRLHSCQAHARLPCLPYVLGRISAPPTSSLCLLLSQIVTEILPILSGQRSSVSSIKAELLTLLSENETELLFSKLRQAHITGTAEEVNRVQKKLELPVTDPQRQALMRELAKVANNMSSSLESDMNSVYSDREQALVNTIAQVLQRKVLRRYSIYQEFMRCDAALRLRRCRTAAPGRGQSYSLRSWRCRWQVHHRPCRREVARQRR